MLNSLRSLVGITLLLAAQSLAATTVTERQYLSGTDKDNTVAWQFFCDAGQNSGKWATIPVPSNWELQGFGIYSYGYDLRPSGRGASATRPAVPIVHAQYKFTFTPKAEWAGEKVFLVFDGAMTDTDVLINGQSAGPTHRGGYYRFRYDVTNLLKLGQENVLEAHVTDESSDASVNNAERRGDFWNYGGIYRPVYLEAVPQEFIDRVAVDAQADGSLLVDVYPGEGTKNADSVSIRVTGPGLADSAPVIAKLNPGDEKVTVKAKYENVKAWSAETPNLYALDVQLLSGQTVLHEMSQPVGFRTIEVRVRDGVYLNGSKIMLKGCDRHTFWPDSGRCMSPAVDLLDINVLKGMNMNGIRSSHYPTDEDFLNQCDQQGIYVLDELAGWHGHYDTEIGHELVKAMVTRDVNHPCVLFWDNGNEGGWNNDLNDDFDKFDPQGRHVLHPQQNFGGINTMHYPDLNQVKRLASQPDVFMPTEFNHGLFDGGAGAGLKEIWDVMEHSKNSAGGFIWAYLDEAVKRTDKNGFLDSNGNEAPDGIVGPFREKEGSYYTVTQIWSPVQVPQSPKFDGSFTNTLAIENHYDFTDLADCKFRWELRKFPGVTDAEWGDKIVAQGTAQTGHVAPRTSGELTFNDLNLQTSKADALALIAIDPHGREIDEWVWPMRDFVYEPKAATAQVPQPKLDANGLLTSVSVNGKDFTFGNGPRAVSGSLQSSKWSVDNASGRLRLEYQCVVGGPSPLTGITFDYPETKVQSKRWLGTGPYRVWGNRLDGGTLNVWKTDFNDGIAGVQWLYPEFKGYFAGIRWMTLDTTEGKITIVPHDPNLFVRVLTPSFPADNLVLFAKTAFPSGNISILNSIPPIGSKGRRPVTQPSPPPGTYNGTVDFYFETTKGSNP